MKFMGDRISSASFRALVPYAFKTLYPAGKNVYYMKLTFYECLQS